MNKQNSTFNQEDRQTDERQCGSMSVDDLSLIDKESPANFVTERDRVPKVLAEMREDQKVFQATIADTLEKYFAKCSDMQAKLLTEFKDVKKSVQFVSEQYDNLKQTSDNLHQRLCVVESNTVNGEQQNTRIMELEHKLDTMEQHARQCNAEICNLPEKRGEDVLALIMNLGNLVKQPISQQDVVAIHRVPQASQNASRPKNIVVKFSNKYIRDNLLAAVRLAKGITSTQLGITGMQHQVYVNEHLTLKNKKLFREARISAKENGYKYVWIKNGSILARANDTSPVTSIKQFGDLQKFIKSSK